MIARSKHVLVVNNSSEQIELKKRHYFTPGKGAEETITRSISNASSILKYGVRYFGKLANFRYNYHLSQCSTPDKAHSVGALQQIVKPATNENDVSPSSLSMKPAEEVMREVYFPDDQFEAARLQNASRNRRVQRESGIVAKSDHALPGLALGTNSPRSNAQSSWPIVSFRLLLFDAFQQSLCRNCALPNVQQTVRSENGVVKLILSHQALVRAFFLHAPNVPK